MYSYPFCGRAYIFFAKIMLFREKTHGKSKKTRERNGKRYKLCSP
jgi:hypothetical protein